MVELLYCTIWIEGISCKLKILRIDAIASLPQELEALIDSGVFMKVSAVAGTTVSASMLDRVSMY